MSVRATTPLPVRFIMGQEVLARWSDGLLYLGRILKVDNAGDRCYIKFEDDSEHWALFKDMFKAASRGEICCRQCCSKQSEAPNEIVLCDNCGAGYHQSCHVPPISSEVLQPNVKWRCRLCVFTSTAKRGGALKKGPNAKAFQVMKQFLPYDACDLKWDGEHKSNVDQCFCYCGGPGEWFMKMLQCCRCRQWFHEACMQCLDFPLVLGDRWYVFVCAICNHGAEYLKRLDLKWVDIAQLALFNLTMEHNQKYYDLSESIVPWILRHWESLQLTQVKEKSKVNIENLLQEKLMSNSGRFACGKEIKKRATLWGLRFRLPPLPPSVVLPAEGQITDECMKNIQKKGRNTKTFVPFHSNSPIPLKCRKRKEQTPPIVQRSAKMKKLMESVCEKGRKRGKVESANQNYKGFAGSPHIANGKSPVNGKSPRKGKSPAQRSKCNLDSIIPLLHSYAGFNHPFKTVLERTEEIEKQKRRSHLRVTSQNVCDTDTDTMSQSSQGDDMEIEQSDSSHIVDMNYIPRLMKIHRRKMSRPHRQVLSSVIMQGVFEPPSIPEKLPNSSSNTPNTTVTRSCKSPDVIDSATIEAVKSQEISIKQLKSSVMNYFGTAERIAQGETFRILARRITPEKKVQYLVEWESSVP